MTITDTAQLVEMLYAMARQISLHDIDCHL